MKTENQRLASETATTSTTGSSPPPGDFEHLNPRAYGQKSFGNVEVSKKKGDKDPKKVATPLPLDRIRHDLDLRDGGHRFVLGTDKDSRLYVYTAPGVVRPLDTTSDLESYLHTATGVVPTWHGNGATLGSFLSHLRSTAPRKNGIVRHLRVPEPDPAQYVYLPDRSVGKGDESLLDRFAGFFSPATEEDAVILRVALLSPMSGLLGAKPCIVVTSTDPGDGKTSVPSMIARAYGQSTLSWSVAGLEGKAGSMEDAFFCDSGLLMDIAVNDNATGLLESQAFCRVITEQELRGAAKYKSTAHRRGDVTWFITTNGLRVTWEAARRCVWLNLGHHESNPKWQSEVETWVDDNRASLLSAIHAVLSRGPLFTDVDTGLTLDAWTHGVLATACRDRAQFLKVVAKIKADRERCDTTSDDTAAVRDALDVLVHGAMHDNRSHVVHIAVDVLEDRFCLRRGHGTKTDRLAAVATSSAMRDSVIGGPVKFPTNGTKRLGIFYRVGTPTIEDYRRDGGVIAVIRDWRDQLPGSVRTDGAYASREVERVLMAESEGGVE